MKRISALALAATLLPGAFASAHNPEREVDVVVDMTPEGKMAVHPTPEHPAYYLPITVGYKEMGALVGYEKPPPPDSVIHLVAVELAKQGYVSCLHNFPATQGHAATMGLTHAPDLVVVVSWGYLNPIMEDGNFFNQNQMLQLVGGNSLNQMAWDNELGDVMTAATEDRYFIAVAAFDAKGYMAEDHKKRKKVCWWQAKMSVSSSGVNFSDVMDAMVNAGGPRFGRETTRPQLLSTPLTPAGRVTVGTPTVVAGPAAPAK